MGHPMNSRSLGGFIVLYLSTVWAFQTNSPAFFRRPIAQQPRGSTLHLFGRSKSDQNVTAPLTDSLSRKSRSFRFFGRGEDVVAVAEPSSSGSSTTEGTTSATTVAETTTTVPPSETTSSSPVTTVQPEAVASRLRSDAEKFRLEAQLMEAELTLQKIKALERKLAAAQNNTKVDKAKLQEDIDKLSNKMSPKEQQSTNEAQSPIATASSSNGSSTPATTTSTAPSDVWRKYTTPFLQNEFEEFKKELAGSPTVFLMLIAANVGIPVNLGGSMNETQVLERFFAQSRCGDFTYSKQPQPCFQQAELDAVQKTVTAVKAEGLEMRQLRSEGKDILVLEKLGNSTFLVTTVCSHNPDMPDDDIARLLLEYEHYLVFKDEESVDLLPFLNGISKGTLFETIDFDEAALESTFATFMPKSVTAPEKEGPTKAEVQKLIKDVLPKAKFSSSSQPTQVPGGWIVRGTFKGKDGDEFIDLLDAAMAKNLEDRMTVTYLPDFTAILSDEGVENMIEGSSVEPILFVTVPNPARESRPVQLAIVTSVGIATCWYLSLYPFLLNTAIAGRVDEELALLDAGMSPNLDWLTDLTFPLFATFIAIQLTHEIGHYIVAQSKGIKTYPPTLVPSILTGITSSVTSLKNCPKNLAATFDFAIAGPIAGMCASLFALLVGSQLSLVSNSMYPALPLEILRQSTLGGGIINGILGEGALNVPNGALGTSAVSQMTVPLHPLAVAGYIGLLINALSLLPIGTTDGGRIALAVFGRGLKGFIGSLFLLILLFVGFAGSDLFLFYASFVLAFETGNEIPARNEVDTIDVPRVCLAIFAYFVAALALIPFQ